MARSLGKADLICDQALIYEALGHQTSCRLRLFRLGQSYVVLLSEDPANEGPSLHNTIEDALARAREQWEILPRNIVAIEHRRRGETDLFSRVSVSWITKDGRMVVETPRWSGTTRSKVEGVLGHAV
jgi:hypothetical protein